MKKKKRKMTLPAQISVALVLADSVELGTFTNACKTAGIEFVGPYSLTYMDHPVDYERIRSGDTKYIVRELFKELYPGIEPPAKIPFPRPVNEWFANWEGPTRKEFIPHSTDYMQGDQKWMVWCLERYLNMIEAGEGDSIRCGAIRK